MTVICRSSPPLLATGSCSPLLATGQIGLALEEQEGITLTMVFAPKRRSQISSASANKSAMSRLLPDWGSVKLNTPLFKDTGNDAGNFSLQHCAFSLLSKAKASAALKGSTELPCACWGCNLNVGSIVNWTRYEKSADPPLVERVGTLQSSHFKPINSIQSLHSNHWVSRHRPQDKVCNQKRSVGEPFRLLAL